MFGRLIRVGDALSQFVNVVLLNGDANESISGRAYREGWTTTRRVIDALFGTGHCKGAYLADVTRAAQLLAQHQRRA
jgi:hypothetical protein